MIATVTLNASIDKAYFMEHAIENGTVMRVGKIRNSAGGKGLNVARVAKICGEQVVATGMVGGFNGAYLEHLLDQDRISHDFQHIQGETRSCINILDEKYGSTEYLEPGCGVTAEEEEQFLEKYVKLLEMCSVITISGSVPSGMSKDIYNRMIAMAKEKGRQVILDTSGRLLEDGIKAKPTMIKPNQDEIGMLFQEKIDSQEELIAFAKKLHQEGISYVVISMGKAGALLVCDAGVFRGIAPHVQAANPVGCGDSMVGAFAVALERKYEPEEALRFALAVSAANAGSPMTGNFDPAVPAQLMEKAEIVRIA